MESFLEDVAKWIRDRPIIPSGDVSKTGHLFGPEDTQDCIDEFLRIEQILIDQQPIGLRVDMQFAILYKNILDILKERSARLVNNDPFVQWVATYEEYPSETPITGDVFINPLVASLFYTAAGAAFIRNEEELANALTAMYYQRVDDGLEIPRPFVDPYAQFDNDILRENCDD